MSGRYNWRHDMVLRKIVEVISTTLEQKVSPQKGTYFKSAKGNKYFIPPLRQDNSRVKPTADDWGPYMG